ncbi:13086_t:CDS:2 [Entrophospora sp. SA101]|nr:13086_t:CDS:2 [Entrophospora sp. SA101]
MTGLDTQICEYETCSLKQNHLELWYLVHIWSFIDRAFEDIDGIEAVSLASSQRKNRGCCISTKKKDIRKERRLIIRKIMTEYGCSEAGTKSLNLPSQIEEFAKVLPIILLAWKAKTIVANVIKLVEKKDETDNDDLELSTYKSRTIKALLDNTPQSKRTKEIPLNQLSPPIPFILSNDDDDTDKENEHLEIV